MRLISVAPALLLSLLPLSLVSGQGTGSDSGIRFITHDSERKIDILSGEKIFTSFCWPENVYKPVLYPVFTSAGTEITRGFPIKPREGERNDHIHQVGIWLNYGNVNGIDFWGNGYRGMKEPSGGVINHLGVEKMVSGKNEGSFISNENWLVPSGKVILKEVSEYHFIARGSVRIIDRVTTLTAGDTTVFFKDTKEGMFGIRVARQLELPSAEGLILLDSKGDPSPVKDSSNSGVTGNYRSSQGATGESVWGTRSKWMCLSGMIGGEKISIVICDHPDNPGYPTYWHARGYGLFAANPFGWNDFTKGKEQFNFKILPGNSAKFRYRVVINSGASLNDDEINSFYDEFSRKY